MSVIKRLLALVLASAFVFGFIARAEDTRDNGTVNWVRTLELDSNRHAHVDDLTPIQTEFTLDGYEKAGENDTFVLWLSQSNNAIRVESKETGYIWGSIDPSTVQGLNKTWKDFAGSIVSIEYFDKKNNEKRLGISGKDCSTYYTMTDNGFVCRAEYEDLKLAFTFSVSVLEEGLHFKVDRGGIEENGNNVFKCFYFVPFFGSVKEDEKPGYMLIPDGSGALIRFSKSVKYLNGYEQRIYGKNYAVDALEEANDLRTSRPNDFAVAEKQVLLPVYGMVNGIDQNAFLAVMGEGAEYGTILSTPAGVYTDFNWTTCRFDVRQRYLQPTKKSGGGIWLPQADPNVSDFEMTMYFLSGEDANYSGMAVLYRNLLESAGTLTRSERVDTAIPVHIDFLGADVKKQFLNPGMQILSTAGEVSGMVEGLGELGVGNITAVLKGFYGKGLNAASVDSGKLNGKLIGGDSYEALRDLLHTNGSRLYLYANPVTANESQLNIKTQAGNTMSKAYIYSLNDNPNLMYTENYFVKSSQICENMAELEDNGLNGCPMAFDGIGSYLYADYTRDRGITRLQAKEELLAALAERDTALAVYGANLYIADHADDMFNVPLLNSQYLFETDSVPFLQIVYKGHVDMYGDYLNVSNLSRTKILKMMEYKVYPSFILTYSDSTSLEDTPSEDLFSTAYEDWKDRIADISDEMQMALVSFEGAKIIRHKVAGAGLVRVDYDNGKSLYINYTRQDAAVDGMVLPAEGYIIKGE